MGTTYSVTITPPYPDTVTELEIRISTLLETINATMSTYIPNSELSIINQSNTNEWIPVSEALFDVISTAEEISKKSAGAFDITIGAVVNLWGFGPDKVGPQPPDKETIAAAMQAVGYGQLETMASPPSIKKHPDSYLDLSGIAKGYAVDEIANLLEGNGIKHYLVEIGGEIRARGNNPRGQHWRVGIERPETETRTVRDIIALDNSGMATSGGYRNFINYNGTRYSHTIDPKTGWPVTHTLSSVTVIDESGMIADALATALLVMGPEAGYEYAEQHDIPALFIRNNDGVFSDQQTTAFLPYLVE